MNYHGTQSVQRRVTAPATMPAPSITAVRVFLCRPRPCTFPFRINIFYAVVADIRHLASISNHRNKLLAVDDASPCL